MTACDTVPVADSGAESLRRGSYHHGVTFEVPPEASSFHLMTDALPIDVLRPGERVTLSAITFMGGGKSIFDIYVTGTVNGEQVRFPSKLSI